MGSGFPNQDVISGHHYTDGESRSDSLGQTQDVWLGLPMFHCEELPGSASPRLNFISNEKDLEFPGKISQSRQEFRGRDDITPLSLDGFDNDGSNILRGDDLLKEDVADIGYTIILACVILEVKRTSVAIGIMGEVNLGKVWTHEFPVSDLAGTDRH